MTVKQAISLFTATVFFASLSASSLVGTASAEVTFNQNRIIDDVIFDNYNTMNAGQIDNFLNSFPSSCISSNSTFRAIDPIGYNPNQSFLYGGNVTAGTVIYHAAQAYEINPQVLLTTLQKEQSLVTGADGCSGPNRYAKAAGYGCPDNYNSFSYTGLNLYTKNGVTYRDVDGVCVNSAAKAGFTQQVIRAAWMLKYSQQRSKGNISWAIVKGNWDNSDDLTATFSGYMTPGCHKRSKYESACTNYDGYATIDNTTVRMDSGATAALYRYTPHFAGNKSFVNIFSSWFGPTLTSAYSWKQADKLLFTDSSKRTVINENGIKRGQSFYAQIKALNTGSFTWKRGVYKQQVNVGTSSPQDRVSQFCDIDWLSPSGCGRSTTMIESEVPPGSVGTFEFWMTAPTQPGIYNEYFNLVADGASWLKDIGFYWRFTVSNDFSTNGDAEPKDRLTANAKTELRRNERLVSPDGKTVLILKPEGFAHIYSNYRSSWQLNAPAGTVLVLQNDGNLVLYNASGQAVWASGTDSGRTLVLQNDGNLVLYNASGQAVWASGSSKNTSIDSWSLSGNALTYRGQTIKSKNTKYTLALQRDGNLVLYSPARALWASNTTDGFLLAQQDDGNLVLYNKSGRATWASKGSGAGVITYLQDDGNLVSYRQDGQPTWATNTPQ